VALWFIPAVMEKIPIQTQKNKINIARKRRVVRFTHFYRKTILFLRSHKWVAIIIFILAFGLPVNKLPEEIKNKDSSFAKIYNKTLGSDYFVDDLKPLLSKLLGGTLRLFTEFVYQNSYYKEPEPTKLIVIAKMSEGSTVHQLNELIKKMENYISKFGPSANVCY